MSYLTAEQAMTLAERVQARLNEFGVLAVHMPQVSPGIVRIVADVLEEWQGETEQVGVWPSASAVDPLIDGFHMGFQLAQQKHTRTANGHAKHAAPVPQMISRMPVETSDMVHQPATSTDFTEFYNAYPTMPDLDGVDLFAHTGAPAGTLAELDEALERELERVDDAIPTPLDGLQIVAPPPLPAPATNGRLAAALRKPRTMAEVDRVAERKAELEAIIALLRDLSVDGKMPSQLEYQVKRPKYLPSWITITKRYEIVTWRQMATLCGLAYEAAQQEHTRIVEPDEVEDATEDDADLFDDDLDDDADDEDAAPTKRKRPTGKREKRERLTRSQEFSRPGPEPKHSPALPTREQFIAELQRQAMGGVMPTQSQFNTSKPQVWGTASAQLQRFGLSWEQAREEAGLKPNPRWARTWERTDTAA